MCFAFQNSTDIAGSITDLDFWPSNIDHAELQEYANWFLAEPRLLYICDFSTCKDTVQ